MTRWTITLFLIAVFVSTISHGQTKDTIDPTTFDYSKADSIALNFPKKKYKYYTELVAPLTEKFQTDHEKLRVLFRWITDNIQYNYGQRSNDADKVVKNKKAVCIGYSTLLKEMCNSANIECEVIIGYSKTNIKDINRKFSKTDHAWNAVKLYGKWYLLDVTWATSYYDEKKRKTVKCFEVLYYLTDPKIFAKKHLPKDKNWQLLEKPITKKEFSKSHIYYRGYFDAKINELIPSKGFIKIKLKDTLEIKFTNGIEINEATIELGNEQFVYYPKIQKRDNYYFIKQRFERPGIYQLTVFLDNYAITAYKLIIKGKK